MPSAAILVGGQARRFGGVDKSALTIGGRTILERQVEALRPLTDDILIVGRHWPAQVPHGVRAIVDGVQESGPLGGLAAALASARDDAVFLLACDMPFLTTALIGYLIGLAPCADAVVPRTDRGYHPLCAVYARRCHEVVIRQLAHGRLAMRTLLEELQVRAVEQDELGLFGHVDRLLTNLNTPAEFDELEAQLGHKL